MDPYLKSLIADLNRGAELPPLRVLAGNTLFVGTPGPSSAVSENVVRGLAEEYYNHRRPKKKEAERVFNEAMDHGQRVGAALTRSAAGLDDEGSVLTLLKCQIWPASGGDGVEVPIVRIPLTSIDGWWPGAGQLLKAPKAGGGWLMGFGVIVPLDLE